MTTFVPQALRPLLAFPRLLTGIQLVGANLHLMLFSNSRSGFWKQYKALNNVRKQVRIGRET